MVTGEAEASLFLSLYEVRDKSLFVTDENIEIYLPYVCIISGDGKVEASAALSEERH